MIICQFCGYREDRSPSNFGTDYKCPSCDEVSQKDDYLRYEDPALKVIRHLDRMHLRVVK